MKRRAAVMLLQCSKRMLAMTVVIVLLSSCDYKVVDPQLSATENIAVESSLYDTYDCPRIIQTAKDSAAQVKHFDDLMAKSGNGFVNALAYGTERTKALANQHAAERAMKVKGCSPDPIKIDNKLETRPK
jgi:PBP1b-binding outer membrane lipoprotein LpoB